MLAVNDENLHKELLYRQAMDLASKLPICRSDRDFVIQCMKILADGEKFLELNMGQAEQALDSPSPGTS